MELNQKGLDGNQKSSIPQNEENIGYLVVRVSTAQGVIPLENAAVSIRGNTPEASGMIFSLSTNRDGLTEKIPLPAPSRTLSEAAGNPIPYSVWNIDVFKEGFVPISFQNVPVYPSIVSVQPALMTPIAENFMPSEIYNESQGPNL